MAIKSNLVIPSVVAMYGENGGKKLEHKIIIKSDTIPTASQKELKKMYCYSGETNDTYHHGYIYECVAEPVYTIKHINFEPHKMGFDYRDADESLGFNSDTEAMTAFLQFILGDASSDYYKVTNGTITLIAGNSWQVVCKDANNIQIGTAYTLYSDDLEDYGFVFLNPVEDYTEGEVLSYSFNFDEELGNYHYERIDVQPGGGSVKFVPELPETGEERYIYGVVLQETTREGYGIIQLFMWYNNSWMAAGAFDVDIDPDELVYKDNIPYATAQKVGGIKQSFDANTAVWTVITENI